MQGAAASRRARRQRSGARGGSLAIGLGQVDSAFSHGCRIAAPWCAGRGDLPRGRSLFPEDGAMTVYYGTTTIEAHADLDAIVAGTVAGGFVQAGTGAVARTYQGKVREVISVTDFGAIGDGDAMGGGSDNADAFDAARARAVALAGTGAAPAIVFPSGVYNISRATNWFVDGLVLIALGRVVIRSTASSGNIMTVDAGSGANGYRFRMVGEFTLDSTNQGVAIGLYTRNVNHSEFSVRVRNVTTTGCLVEGAVLSTYRLACSEAGQSFTTTPVNGLVVNDSAILSSTTDCDFRLIVETASGDGVVLNECDACRFSGTSEGVGGRGVYLSANAGRNCFDAFFMEANVLGDVDCDGNGNRFVNCVAASRAASSPYESVKSVIFGAGAERNVWQGGFFFAASVEATAQHNGFWQFDSDFRVLDSGLATTIYGRQDEVSSAISPAQIPIQDAFASLSTINGWSHTSGTYPVPALAANRSTGEVLVRGEVGSGSSGTVIATLPSHRRPSKVYTFVCAATAGSAHAVVNVQPNGNIQHLSGNTASIDLSVIRFFLT
jgi:hypothetical protein